MGMKTKRNSVVVDGHTYSIMTCPQAGGFSYEIPGTNMMGWSLGTLRDALDAARDVIRERNAARVRESSRK